MDTRRNLALFFTAAFLRSFSTGALGVVLAVYLSRNGLSATWIGAVIAVGLAGNAAATALVSYRLDAIGRRRSLVCLALLAATGGIALAWFGSSPALLLPFAFIAMLNGMGTDRSAAFAIEQAAIPNLVSDRQRTWVLSWYNVTLDTSGALGALSGALPIILQRALNLDIGSAYKWLFLGYSLANGGAEGVVQFVFSGEEVAFGAAFGGVGD